MYKDIKFNKKKIVVSLIEIIIFVLVGVSTVILTQKVYATSLIEVYDFSSGAGINKWGYYGKGYANDIPVAVNRSTWAEPGVELASYTNIESANDVHEIISDTTEVFKEVVHDFVITINENPVDINSIELYWEGYAGQNIESLEDNDLRMYLYNVNTTAWELVASSLNNSCPGPSDCTLTYTTTTANFSNYIDGSGHLRYLVQKFEQGDACDATCHKVADRGTYYPPGCTHIPSGYVRSDSGEQTAVSSSNYCNYDEDCDDGDCSATKWWTSCNGSGSCRAAADHVDAYSENVYAGASYTLTSSCGTTGTTICGYSAFYKCSGACQKGRDKYRCSSAHTCSEDVGDSWSYLSTAGRVCSGGGEINPSSSLYCDITIQCAERDCSAEKWYRGCTSGGSSCIGNLSLPYGMQLAGVWNASAGYVVNTTEYKVGTSCSQTTSKGCSFTCKTCNGSGLCNVYKTTNWGANNYDCAGSAKRCVSGTCRTCNGYLYSDGCSGCAGQGGNACWHRDRNDVGGYGCGDVCSSYGGCIDKQWDDNSSCTVCKNLFDTSAGCDPSSTPGNGIVSPMWANALGDANRCRYRGSSYNQDCSAGPGGFYWRLCVCLW
ncbi:MAG: hypothetical protein IB617_00270 [Candidatus Nealsonbacteria bacterium]|nr:MAG: hypothetical protein IB617_00270 [Candidatus Nealsonbacteria bacterium]